MVKLTKAEIELLINLISTHRYVAEHFQNQKLFISTTKKCDHLEMKLTEMQVGN